LTRITRSPHLLTSTTLDLRLLLIKMPTRRSCLYCLCAVVVVMRGVVACTCPTIGGGMNRRHGRAEETDATREDRRGRRERLRVAQCATGVEQARDS
jgi:hypothetical protein